MTTGRDIKERLNASFAQIGHALSSPKRLELLELLHQCEKTVDTLSVNTAMSIANTSRHLQVLKNAGLVESRREGTFSYYRLAGREVHDLASNLKRVAQSRIADVDRALADWKDEPDQIEQADRRNLLNLARTEKITLLDVRPADEFAAAHLPFAVSIPLGDLKNQFNHLPRERKIVTYCRGPYCLLAGEAVRFLRSKGYNAVRLGDGVGEWSAAGQPTVSSHA